MEQQKNGTSDAIKEVNEGRVLSEEETAKVDEETALPLEDAVEKVQEASQKETGEPGYYAGRIIKRFGMDGHMHTYQEMSEEDASRLEEQLRDQFPSRIKHYGEVFEACLREAKRIAVKGAKAQMVEGQSDSGPGGSRMDVALAIFRKVTEGEERRELTALFGRVANWWMEREEKQTADLEASRDSFIAAANSVATPVPERDPIIRGLQGLVTVLMDIIENSLKHQHPVSLSKTLAEEMEKQLAQEVEDDDAKGTDGAA